MFARVQLLLEETQDKIRKAEQKWQNSETQIRALAGRIQTIEGQLVQLRAQAMTAVELAGKTSGDNGHSGD